MAEVAGEVDEAIDEPERAPEDIPATARNRYLEAALDEGAPSRPLRAVLEHLLGRQQAPAVAVAASAPVPVVN